MWTYGFFNSVNGDRAYNADQMSKIFEGLITDGVYEAVGNKLAVQPNSGMTVQIATGRGWFNGRWVNNDAPYTLALEASDVTLSRYVAICIRVDATDAVRSAVPYLKYSSFATNPVKPTMTRSATVNEYCLAYVKINPRATTITSADIEDTRFNSELCGWVTGLIEQIDTTTLYEQWGEIFNGFMSQSAETFNEWFGGLVDIIDEDVETTLVNAMPKNATITLTVAGWQNKQQTVTVVGMTPTKSVIVESLHPIYDEFGIRCVGQTLNGLIFTCQSVPNMQAMLNVTFMGT